MKKYEAVLFDLDGTLTRSGDGILYSVRYTFEAMNKTLPPKEELRRFIGPPLASSMHRCGFTEEETEQGIVLYKQKYAEKGMYMNEVYDGIPQVLTCLREKGYKLSTATTKVTDFTVKILEYFSLTQSFDFIAAASADTSRRTKEKVLEYALENLGITPDKAVLIGDTLYDAQGAFLVGCDFIGVTYGYGTQEEMLEKYPKAQFVKTPLELLTLL